MLDCRVDLGIHPLEFEYVLVDLSQIPDQLLRERLELEPALTLFRHSRDEDFPATFTKILPLMAELRRKETGLEYIETILRYVYYVRSEDEWEDVVDLFHRAEPDIEEIAMATIAEYLIRKGKAEGWQQGHEQGVEKGMEKGKISEAHDVLPELLEEQFGIVPLRLTEKLRRIQSHEVLRMLRRRRKTCQSLDDFEQLIEKALQ